MTGVGKRIRLRRIFRNGKALIIAVDHGIRFGPIKGIEDPRVAVRHAREGGADAIMATPPVVEHVYEELGDMSIIARIDGGATTLGPDITLDEQVFRVEEAVEVGADAVVAFGYIGVKNECQQVRKLSAIAGECRRLGVPLFAEMIPREIVEHHYGRESGEISPENVALAVRVGWEVGADAIKTYYTGSPASFRKVVEASPLPVLILGGPKAEGPVNVLKMVEEAVSAGAMGAIMGRNVWQHKNPRGMVEALSAIIHEGLKAEEALKLIG